MSEHKVSPQPQRFTAAIELLAKLTSVEVSLLTEPLALGYPYPQVTQLQSALLRKLHHQIPAELENALLKKNTRAMINALRDMMPAALRHTCPAEQLEAIQSLLEILGFENARHSVGMASRDSPLHLGSRELALSSIVAISLCARFPTPCAKERLRLPQYIPERVSLLAWVMKAALYLADGNSYLL